MNKEIKPPKTSFQLFNTDGGENKSNGIEIPSIALPKGGGAIKGIDEKFSVNAVNGTASFSIPLPFSPGRGASLTLSLNYNSGAGNGIFGLGWKLSLPSIKRKTDKELPKYTDSDTCLFSEADDLVPQLKKEDGGALVLDENGNCMVQENDSSDGFFTIRLYRPRIEGLFARIERWTHKATGEIKWRVITKENITTLFGWSVASRIADPQNENKIFDWLPEFVFDDKGNCSRYVYKNEDGQGRDASLPHNRNRTANGNINYTNLYLEKVLYGNKTPYKKIGAAYPAETDYLFQTVFDYGEYDVNAPYAKIKDWDCRKDEFSQYRAGFEIRTTRLCRRVLLFHYFAELPGGAALVKSLNFSYDPPDEADFALLQSITAYGYIRKPDGTYTNKNLPPLELKYAKFAWNKDINFIAQDDSVHTPPELDEPQQQFADLFNEGLPGMLTKQGEGWFYRHNLGNGRFAAAKPVSPQPSFAGAGSRLQLMDLDADGGKQLVSLGSEPKGYFELNDEEEWQVFRSFKNLPNINWRDSNARMIDLNGDGRAEILITED
ncbi:MAG: SpvB/TcaC N-terminal domain-containing protein, partial [Smithellaceae bacterium]